MPGGWSLREIELHQAADADPSVAGRHEYRALLSGDGEACRALVGGNADVSAVDNKGAAPLSQFSSIRAGHFA